jgi:hypothetical protein
MVAPTETLDKVLHLATLVRSDMARFQRDSGLTTARTHLLWVLGASGPSTQQALAGALDVSARNITGLVESHVDLALQLFAQVPSERLTIFASVLDDTIATFARLVLDVDDGLALVGAGSRTNLELALAQWTTLSTSKGAVTVSRVGIWVDEPREVAVLLTSRLGRPAR